MAKLFYQGHASLRITANSGKVIFVDPSPARDIRFRPTWCWSRTTITITTP